MKVINYTDVEMNEVIAEGVSGAKIRKVLTSNDGAPNFSMRIFELDKDGHTPFHKHQWEHEIFILEGKGELVLEDGSTIELIPGKAALITPEEVHQFRNTSEETFKFMCLVPNAYA